ncbi:insulinase family protein [Candidatus Microgenomates bacterium]|nr:insulinase family protein [Candidatus Microgenomates bacterium]
MYFKTLLKNNLRVVSVPMESVKSATALIMVEAGSRYETPEINGISHFLEHMIFKGTKNRPTAHAISSIIDGIGGAFNAFTSKEYTGFYVKAESSRLELILDVLSDMLQNSLFDPKELDKERGVIIEEINMYEDLPQVRVEELFEELLYGTQPLAKRISGTKEIIKDITQKQMLNYVNRMYHASSIVAGLAGNVGAIHESPVQKYFSNVPAGKENSFAPIDDSQNGAKSLVYNKATYQAHLLR